VQCSLQYEQPLGLLTLERLDGLCITTAEALVSSPLELVERLHLEHLLEVRGHVEGAQDGCAG
jgi:hypothetical protein